MSVLLPASSRAEGALTRGPGTVPSDPASRWGLALLWNPEDPAGRTEDHVALVPRRRRQRHGYSWRQSSWETKSGRDPWTGRKGTHRGAALPARAWLARDALQRQLRQGQGQGQRGWEGASARTWH